MSPQLSACAGRPSCNLFPRDRIATSRRRHLPRRHSLWRFLAACAGVGPMRHNRRYVISCPSELSHRLPIFKFCSLVLYGILANTPDESNGCEHMEFPTDEDKYPLVALWNMGMRPTADVSVWSSVQVTCGLNDVIELRYFTNCHISQGIRVQQCLRYFPARYLSTSQIYHQDKYRGFWPLTCLHQLYSYTELMRHCFPYSHHKPAETEFAQTKRM
ncbi:hypothetical protein LSAT2_001817 [Lamellibrachia satsuma]|nr:hypothetical protein LSAT2_001817 [Lamellibrachia satsuma]